MHKEPSWRAKAMYIVFAFALVFGLAGVVAMPAQPAAEASPDVTFRLSAASTAGKACWSTTQKMGTNSVKLDHDVTAGSVYVEFVPEPGTTLDDLKALINEWSFWYYLTAAPGPQFELLFRSCSYDPTTGNGEVYVTIMAAQHPHETTGAWTEVLLTSGLISTIYYGRTMAGVPHNFAAGGKTLDTAVGEVIGFYDGAWELARVRVELWEGGDRDCYIDDVTIDGTLYAVEQGPEFWLDPVIGYNVKTATETFTAMGPCGPLVGDDQNKPANDPYVVSWSVEKGCGVPGGGDVTIVAGTGDPADGNGKAGDKFVTVRLNTKGDAHICATIDPDGTVGTDDNIEVCAEKKWGEIYCTRLTKGDLVDDETCVTEYVEASFLWYDCSDEIELPADDAVVDWWLMGVGALPAVQALEAALGNDPCDANGGCGAYTLGFFSYDVDGNGTPEVYNSPRAAMLAIYAKYGLGALKATNYIVGAGPDPTHTTTASDVDGLTAVTVHIQSLAAVMLATLTDYPIDKSGQNAVCVQHETWAAPPPEVQVKIPQVAWAGEKIVLEKNWGGDFQGRKVTFQVDQGSIGTLSPITGSSSGQVVVTTVDAYGVARAILESEYEGQAEVKCVLYNTEGTEVIDNHDFPVFFIKLESVEAIGTYPTVEVGVAVDFGLQVKGWFITGTTELAVDPDTDEVRAEKPVDVDGDGTIDQILPRGRWVLPDDWSRLAGIFETRRHWDLMDNATDAIDSGTSNNPLGPFNTAVVTTNPPNMAQKNVVGPFSTTQPVALEGGVIKWIATATVVGDDTLTSPAKLRTTVVPNGILEWQDCPMPAAYLMFTVSGTTLSQALKTGVAGYFTGTSPVRYEWPFYSYEIPSSRFIPIGGVPEGYRWDSWGWGAATAGGPYGFWRDLGVSTANTELEVYTDNNGRAYVTLNARTTSGFAIISGIADYPYQRKHPAMKSANITIGWGAIDLNPHFSVSDTEVLAEVDITFVNLTTGGEHFYLKAEWDWEGDGTYDLILDRTTNNQAGEDVVMATQTYAYPDAGVYYPKLRMTDSIGTTRHEVKDDPPITVGGAVPTTTWTFVEAGFFARVLPSTYSGEVVLDTLTGIPTQVQMVHWDNEDFQVNWPYWLKGVGPMVPPLTSLTGNCMYMVSVSGPCTWVITLTP